MGASIRPTPLAPVPRPGQPVGAAEPRASQDPEFWARRWDALVKAGTPPDEATKRLLAEGAPPPEKDLTVPEAENRNPARGGGADWSDADLASGRGTFMADPSRAALQGATLGFGDEITAAANAAMQPGPFGENYARNVTGERAALAEYRQAHPWKSFGAEIVGGAALPLGSLGALKPGATLGQRAVAGAKIGGAVGATATLGAAEGTPVDRAKALASPGGLAGVGASSLLGAAAPGLQEFAGYLADVLGLRAATKLAPAPAGTLYANPVGPAAGAVRDALVDTNRDRALSKTLQALRRSGVTLDDVRREYSGGPPKPETLMDLGGRQTTRLATAARGVPSRGSEHITHALESRAATAEDRVLADLAGATGQPRINVLDHIDDIAARRGAEADQMYGAIHDLPVDDPRLATLLKNKKIAAAYERVRGIVDDEIAAGNPKAAAPLPALADLFDQAGNLKAPLTLRTIDQIKRGIDDMLSARGGVPDPSGAGGLGREGTSAVRDLRRALIQVAEDHVPQYKDARSAFAGHSAMIEAMDEGQRLWQMRPAEAERLLRDYGASELEAFRKGAVEALAGKVEGIEPGHNIPQKMGANKTVNKQRLRMLFDTDEEFEAFRQNLQREARMHQIRGAVTGGSQTAEKLAALADLADVPIGPVAAAATGNVQSLLGTLWNSGARQRLAGRTEGIADALAPILTAGAKDGQAAPAEFLDVLDELFRASEREARKAARGQTYGKAAAGAVAPRLNQPNR